MKGKNPFPFSGYAGPAYFCDREKELAAMTEAVMNGRHLLLLSVRRMGKTALLQRFSEQMQDNKVLVVSCDLQATMNQQMFLNLLATAIWQAAPEAKPWGKRLLDFLKSLRPVVTYNELTGKPEVTINTQSRSQQKATLDSMFNHLDAQKIHVCLVMDEFQQIDNYPEKNMEAQLRTVIQTLKNTTCIFSGSQPHLLSQMFGTAKRPFFGMTQMMKLHPLDRKTYGKFILKHFSKNGIKLADDALEFILDWTRVHTYYTQALCNRTFSMTSKTKLSLNDVTQVAAMLLDEFVPMFLTYRNMLTDQQWKLLSAIAKEDRLYEPTSGKFLGAYGLGGSSGAKRALDALLSKEMIFYEVDEEGTPYFSVYDLFLSRWLEMN